MDSLEFVGICNVVICYGLGNFVENVIDFVKLNVVVLVSWDDNVVSIFIMDDGLGFF